MQNASTGVKSKRIYVSVHNARMSFDDRPDAARRLEQARIDAGFVSAREAALRFGWVYETYVQHESGLRGITRAAAGYAKAFKVSRGWLLTGEGPGPDAKWSSLIAVMNDLDPEQQAEVRRHAEGLRALKIATAEQTK